MRPLAQPSAKSGLRTQRKCITLINPSLGSLPSGVHIDVVVVASVEQRMAVTDLFRGNMWRLKGGPRD